MRKTFFTSDTHFGHANIIKYSKRPFESVELMNRRLIENWNNTVGQHDTVWHLGDFGFGRPQEMESILNRLNGEIYFTLGNHDKPVRRSKWLSMFKNGDVLSSDKNFFNIQEISIRDEEMGLKQKIILCHFPIESWNHRHHGAWHLHGHCIDLDTEVLTKEGWKHRSEILQSDLAATINLQTGNTEYQSILNIIDKDYSGEVINISGRNISARLTDKHTCIIRDRYGHFNKILAKDFDSRTNRLIPLHGQNTKLDFPISDDGIRLMVWIAADGNLENKNLIRFHLKKERKISRLENLLNRLCIQFSKNKQKNSTTKINFNLDLLYPLKPFPKQVLRFSKRQVDILVEEYCHTDGCKTSDRGFQIATSKKTEADMLQHLLVTNSYSCNLTIRHSRNPKHKTRYILSGNSKSYWQTTNSQRNISRQIVRYEPFWCLVVQNQTLFIRHNGKVHITGNCHGTLPSLDHQARMDVGVDAVGQFSHIDSRINAYYPIEYEQVKAVMTRKVFKPIDHHT